MGVERRFAETAAYENAMAFKPQAVIFMLGTNDAKQPDDTLERHFVSTVATSCSPTWLGFRV